jgi:hypothetical protein
MNALDKDEETARRVLAFIQHSQSHGGGEPRPADAAEASQQEGPETQMHERGQPFPGGKRHGGGL